MENRNYDWQLFSNKNTSESEEIKKSEIEDVEKIIEIIKVEIEKICNRKKEINKDEIDSIRELLSKIPNLVINFDDTITQPPKIDPADPDNPKENQSIALIIDFILEKYEKDKKRLKEKKDELKQWRKIIQEARDGKRSKDDIVKYFYEDFLKGESKENIERIYDEIEREGNQYKNVSLNDNFFEACKYLKEIRGITRIPLFILSLNTPDLINKFHKFHEKEFKNFEEETGIKVEIIAIMGNQIKCKQNEEGIEVVAGIIQHVRDSNKHKYIPKGTIMFADNRETKLLVKQGVNVVNIQGLNYSNKILNCSFLYSNLLKEKNISKKLINEINILNIILMRIKLLNERIYIDQKEKKLNYKQINILDIKFSENFNNFNIQYNKIMDLLKEERRVKL